MELEIRYLIPEIILLAAACVCTLMGLSRKEETRKTVQWVAAMACLAACIWAARDGVVSAEHYNNDVIQRHSRVHPRADYGDDGLGPARESARRREPFGRSSCLRDTLACIRHRSLPQEHGLGALGLKPATRVVLGVDREDTRWPNHHVVNICAAGADRHRVQDVPTRP